MTGGILTVFGIVGITLALLLSEKLRADLIAVLTLLMLVFTGLVSPQEAVHGFGSPAVMTVCAIFILSAGLYRTGVAGLLGRFILRHAGESELRLVLALMVVSAFMSFFMNTIGIVALLLPVVMDMARSKGIAPSKLLMPLSFGALLGGLTTPFATLSNILINNSLHQFGLKQFGLFDFAPIGITAAGAGILFLATIGRRLLPDVNTQRSSRGGGTAELRSQYGLDERIFTLRLPIQSVLGGKTLSESRLGSALGLHVVGILRGSQTMLAPAPDDVLRPLDRLIIQGTPDQLEELEAWQEITIDEDIDLQDRWVQDNITFDEFKLAPGSPLCESTLAATEFRQRFKTSVIAVRRGHLVRRSDLQDWRFAEGDMLLLHGSKIDAKVLKDDCGLAFVRHFSPAEADKVYELQERIFGVNLPVGTRYEGRTLRESHIGNAFGAAVVALTRGSRNVAFPTADEVLRAGDRLVLIGRSSPVEMLIGLKSLELVEDAEEAVEAYESSSVGMVETVLSPRSSLADKTLHQIDFRKKHGLTVVGIWRNGTAHSSNLRDWKLSHGDALLIHGPRKNLVALSQSRDFIVLTEDVATPQDYSKAPLAVAGMAIFLLPSFLGWLPIYISAIAGAAFLVLTRCLKIEDAYAAIDLKSVVLIAGMLPLSIALQETGGAAWAAQHITAIAGHFGAWAVVGTIFILASLGTCVIPAATLVVLMAPVAYNAALAAEVSPHTFMMALALAAAGSFNSPVAHPSNTMITGPGGYRFADFLKVGLPLTLVVFTVVMLLLPRFWPLTK